MCLFFPLLVGFKGDRSLMDAKHDLLAFWFPDLVQCQGSKRFSRLFLSQVLGGTPVASPKAIPADSTEPKGGIAPVHWHNLRLVPCNVASTVILQQVMGGLHCALKGGPLVSAKDSYRMWVQHVLSGPSFWLTNKNMTRIETEQEL